MHAFQQIAEITAFAADFLTIILAVITLWALVTNRKKIKLVFRVVLNAFQNERIRKIKETLSKLGDLNFREKEQRKAVLDLLGQLCGQIKPFAAKREDFRLIHVEVVDLVANPAKLTEPCKRKILSEVEAALDSVLTESLTEILE